jgi:ribonucleotide reductase beta subunit family protein with ferritin-like domain
MRISKEKKTIPFFEYMEGLLIQIRYINDDEVKEVLDQSTDVSFDKRHQKDKEIDNMKFNRKMTKMAIVGWKPFKRSGLRYLISPEKKINLDEGETMDDLVEYSKEMFDLIVENTHVDFMNFVMNAARSAGVYIRAEEKLEIENL